MSSDNIRIIYIKFVYEYLMRNTNINNVDEMFSICFEFDFPPISKESMDQYQIIASNYLKYFYIRNDIDINNLTDDEKRFIEERIQNNNLDYNEEINDFIRRTLPRVISKEDEKLGDSYLINYGPASSEYYIASNKSLVIGFMYNEYVNDDLDDYESQIKYMEREDFVETQCKKLEQEMSRSLNIDVKVLEYKNVTNNVNDEIGGKSL